MVGEDGGGTTTSSSANSGGDGGQQIPAVETPPPPPPPEVGTPSPTPPAPAENVTASEDKTASLREDNRGQAGGVNNGNARASPPPPPPLTDNRKKRTSHSAKNGKVASTRSKSDVVNMGGPENQPLNGSDPKNTLFSDTIRPLLGEFVGTCMFIFLVCMTANSKDSGLMVGLSLAVTIAIFASVSGGHVNPAVTLGVILCEGIAWKLGIGYIICQLAGAILAAGFYRAAMPEDVYKVHPATNALGAIASNASDPTSLHSISAGEGILIEMLLTTVLVMAVLMTAVDEKGQLPFAPFVIGLSVGADAMVGGAYTGASMNPARSFGPAVMYGDAGDLDVWEDHYVYWIGPFLGSLLSAVLYRSFMATPDKRLDSLSKKFKK